MLRKFKKFHFQVLNILLCSVVMLFCMEEFSFSLPQVDEVISGSAQITQPNNTTLQINADNNTIINYSSFNINENESVVINLPSADAQILNRVLGNSASQLLGNLDANGLFILVNPSGIYIGPKATIDAASIVMSTRDINNADFQNGNYLFQKLSQEQLDQLLLNEGTITIQKGGFGVLIAGGIENKGKIIAQAGTVALASGDAVRLDIAKGGLISVAVEKETAATVVDSNGNAITDQIKNSGTIQADGGTVLLDADSVSGIFKKAINLEGYATANKVESKDGVIRIVADQDVRVNATVRATNIEVGNPNNKVPENVEIVGGSLEAEKNITLLAKNNITTNTDLTSLEGDIKILADQDNNGKGNFTQSAGTIYARKDGDIYVDASETMSLLKLKTDDGFIKIGTQRTPKEITGSPYYIHTKGHFEINTKSESNNLATLQTSRGDVLKYNTQGSLTLEANAGKVMDLTDSVLKANTLKLTGQEFLVKTNASDLEIYKTLNDFTIDRSSSLEGFITLEGESVKLTYPATSRITLKSDNPIRTSGSAVISAQKVTLISNKFGEYTTPVRISANEILVSRLSGTIEILDSTPIGSDIWIRGPPAGGFGAISYNRDTTLTLQAQKVTFSSSEPTYLYGNITFYNFSLTIPDKELYFEAGKTYTFKDRLEIIGSPDQGAEEYYIKMRSQTPGTQWIFNRQTENYTLNRINISDAYATSFISIPIGVNAGGLNDYTNMWYIDPVWDGGGSTTNWSEAANWDGNAVPATTETVTFSGDTDLYGANADKNCTVDALGTWSGGNLTIASGYSGTITVNVAMTINNFSQAAGTFDVQDVTININGTTSISGGIYNTGTNTNTFGDNSSDTVTISNGTFNIESDNTTLDIIKNAGTWTNSGGTITFNPSGDVNTKLLSALSPYNNIDLGSTLSTYTLDGAITINGNYQSSGPTLDTDSNNSYAITIKGGWTSFGGKFTANSGTVTFSEASGVIGINTNGTGATKAFYNLTHDGAGTLQLNAAIDINGTFTNSGGTFDANGNNMSVAGGWVNTATFTSGSNTVTFDGGSTQTINAGGTGDNNKDFNNITVSGSTLQLVTTNLEIDGTLTIDSSKTVDLNGKNINIGVLDNSGNLQLQGGETVSITTMDTNSGTVTYAGTGTYSSGLVAGDNYYNLTFNGSGGSWTLDAALDVNNALTITAGTLDVNSSSNFGVTVGGNYSNSGTLTPRSGTFTFDAGSGTQTLNSGGTGSGKPFYAISHTGAGTLQLLTNAIDIDDDFSNSAGTFDANALNMNVGGDWSNTATYTSGNNTTTFDGSGNATINTGGVGTGNDFQNFTVNKSSSAVLQIVTNNLDIDGNLYVQAGVLDLNSKNITTTTSFSNDGTIRIRGTSSVSWTVNDVDSGTAEFIGDSDGSQDIYTLANWASGSSADYYHLTINAADAAEVYRTNATIVVAGNLTVTSGTLDISTNAKTLGVAGTLTVNGGTLTGTDGTIDVDGNVSISSGTLTAPDSGGTFNIGGNFTLNGGTFNNSSGTVTFDKSSGTQDVTSGGTSFYNLTHSGAGTLNPITNTFTVTNTFTNSGGDISQGADFVVGNWTQSSGTFERGGDVTINGDFSLSGTGWFKTGGVRKNTFGDATADAVTISGGTFELNSDDPTSSNRIVINAGTWTNSGGTVRYSYQGASVTLLSTISPYYNLDVNVAGDGYSYVLGGNVTVSNQLTISDGTLNASSYTITLSGTTGTPFTNSDTFTASTSTVSYTGNNTDGNTTVAGVSYYNLTINNSSETFALGGDTTVSNVLTLSAGALTASSYTLTLSGTTGTPFSNSGTFTASTSTISYTGNNTSGNTTIAAVTYNNLTINNASETYVLGNDTTVSNVLTLSAGTLDASSSTLTLSGTTGTPMTGSGTFTASTSTVSYTGNNSGGNTTVAAVTYNSLTLNNSSETFVLAADTTVGGNLTITAGTLDVVSGSNFALNIGGNWSNSGTFTPRSGTVTFNKSSGTQTLDADADSNGSGANFNNLTKLGGGTLQLINSDLTADGNVVISAGTFDINDRAITINGNSTLSGGTYMTGTGVNTFGNASTDSITIEGGTMEIESDVTNTDLVANATNLSITGGTIVYKSATAVSTKLLKAFSPYYNLEVNSAGSTYTLNGNISVANNFTITAGTVDADATNNYNFTITGSWTDSGTFTARAGRVTFNATTTGKTITSNGSNFYNLTFNGVGGGWTLQDALGVTNNLTITNGTLDVNSSSNFGVTVGGNFSIAATFTSRSGLLTLNGTADQTLTTNGQTFYGITVNNTGVSGSDDIIVSGALDIDGNLTITDGDLDLDTNDPNVTLAGNLSIASAGSVTKGSGSWTFDGSGTSTWSDSSSSIQDLGAVTINGSSKTISTSTNVKAASISVGADDTFNITDDTLTLTGTGSPLTITSGGTFTTTSSTVVYAGAATITAVAYNNLTLTPTAAATYTLGGNLTGANAMAGDLTINANATLDADSSNNYNLAADDITIASSGTYTARASSITISGSLTNSGTLTAGTSTVAFNSTSTGKTITSGGSNLYNLTFNGTGGGWTLQDALNVTGALNVTSGTFNANSQTAAITGLATVNGGTYQASSATQTFTGELTISSGTFSGSTGDVDVNGDLTLSGGTLTAPSGTFTVSGNWVRTGGTFTQGTGTVTFDGSGTSRISGSTTFYNLKNVTAGKQLTFTAGTTQTVTGTLTLTGASGSLIKLRSSSSGTQWSIDPQGTRSITYVDVQDSNNINSVRIDVSDGTSINSGNNTNWYFGAIAASSVIDSTKVLELIRNLRLKAISMDGVIELFINALIKTVTFKDHSAASKGLDTAAKVLEHGTQEGLMKETMPLDKFRVDVPKNIELMNVPRKEAGEETNKKKEKE